MTEQDRSWKKPEDLPGVEDQDRSWRKPPGAAEQDRSWRKPSSKIEIDFRSPHLRSQNQKHVVPCALFRMPMAVRRPPWTSLGRQLAEAQFDLGVDAGPHFLQRVCWRTMYVRCIAAQTHCSGEDRP